MLRKDFVKIWHCHYPFIDALQCHPTVQIFPLAYTHAYTHIHALLPDNTSRDEKPSARFPARVQVWLCRSTIGFRSRYRSKCITGCALIRGRQLKPPLVCVSERLESYRGRGKCPSPVLLLSVDLDTIRWHERQLGSMAVLQRDSCLRNEMVVDTLGRCVAFERAKEDRWNLDWWICHRLDLHREIINNDN